MPEHHHADRVRDDVVELPGDPGALLGDGEAGPFVSVARSAAVSPSRQCSRSRRARLLPATNGPPKKTEEECEVAEADWLAGLDRCQRDRHGRDVQPTHNCQPRAHRAGE